MALGAVAPGVTLSADGNALAQDLLAGALAMHKLVAAPRSNAVFSPFAVQAAVGMTYLGAQGATQSDVAAAMRWRQAPQAFGAAWRNLTSVMATSLAAGTSKVDVGTRLWREGHYTVLPDFAAALAQDFGASSVPLDFAGNAEHSRQTINAWVYAQTGNKIADLLPEAAVTPATSSVLTAALHLKAPWRATFKELPASPNNFRSGDGTSYAATMVHTQSTLGYAVDGNTRAVEVALGRGELVALFVVPDGALESYVATLDANALASLRSKVVAQKVDLTLPKAAVAQTLALSDVLAQLGMTVATSDAANLQFFTSGVPQRISAAFSKATFALDVDGIEAAAAAAVVVTPTSASPVADPVVKLVVDRPFLFFVYDAATRTVLFAGQVDHP